MGDSHSEKKTYETPTLEKKRKLPEIVEGPPAPVSGVAV